MANVIDTLFIELGIEDRNFQTQAKNAEKQFSNLEKSVIKTENAHKKATVQVKKADEQIKKLSAGLNVAFRAFATLTASIMGASGFSKLANDISKANIELENTSKNLGLTSREFSKLNGAMEMTGENASGMTSYMKSLSNDINSFVMMGDSSVLPYFNALGIGLLDSSGKARNLDAVLIDLSDKLSTMDRKQAYTIAKHLGMDDGTANTLMRGREEMQRLLDLQKDIYVSSEQEIENSRKLAEMQGLLSLQFKGLKTIIGNALTPVLIFLSEKLTSIIQFIIKHKKETESVFLGIASAITLFMLPAITSAIAMVTAFLLPFTPLIAAVTALSGAFVLLFDDYKTWANGGKSLFDWGAFTNYIKNTNLSVNNLGKAFIYLTTGYKDLSQATNSLIDWLKLKGFIDNNTVSVNSLITGFKNLSREIVENMIPHLQRLADMFLKLFSGDFKGALNIAKEIGSDAWLGLKYLGEDVKDRLTGTVDVATGQEVGTLNNTFSSSVKSGKYQASGKYKHNQDIIVDEARKAGLDPAQMLAIAHIESGFNNNARNSTSSAKGLYQFITDTGRKYGLNSSNVFDARTNARAGMRFTRDNMVELRKSLGRNPTTGELYLAHQQGLGGAKTLLNHKDENVVDALSRIYSRRKAIKVVTKNGGNTNMTAGQFANMWVNKGNRLYTEYNKRFISDGANIAKNNMNIGRKAVNANKNVNNNTNIVVNGGINVHTSANTISGNMADAGKAFSNRVNQYAVAQM